MLFRSPVTVTSLQVFESDFQKRDWHAIPARPFHSLTFRYGGKIALNAGGEQLISEADCITYMPAGMAYTSQIMESGHMTIVHFGVLQENASETPAVIYPKNPDAFSHLFAALEEAYTGSPRDYQCMALFYEILGTLEGELARQSGPSRWMAESKLYIDKNFGSRDLSVAGLAGRVNVSPVYFRKMFRQTFGMAPLAYIKDVRLKNAKALLKTGYYTVTEAAEKCGFDSLSYFCSEFHRFTGSTPGDYLKKYNSK